MGKRQDDTGHADFDGNGKDIQRSAGRVQKRNAFPGPGCHQYSPGRLAGVDWNIIEPLKLSVNFVNVLFQNGAKGSIDVADTITDASLLNDYVMAGSYIRPFTIDFMLTYKF